MINPFASRFDSSVRYLSKTLSSSLKVVFSVLFLVALTFSFSSPASAATVNVDMGGGPTMLAFQPSEVQVAPGDTVHFEIKQAAPHNMVFDTNAPADFSQFSHKDLMMAGGFDVVIPDDAAAGTYNFWCDPHRGAGMVGKLIVQ